MYLQFKTIEEKQKFFGGTYMKEVWRFVPDQLSARVHGYYLHKESCPSSMRYDEEANLLHSFYNHQDSLKSFAKSYPDIEVYFQQLRESRQEYLKREEDRDQNAKTTYL